MNSEGLRLAHLPALALGLLGCAVSAGASAGPTHLSEAWLTVASRSVLSDLEEQHPILVDHGGERTASGLLRAKVLGTSEALERLRSQGLEVEVLPTRRIQDDGRYSTPTHGDALLRKVVSASPRAGITRLGTSVEGRPILGAWFGQHPGSGAADVRVLAAHHGDEWSSFEVALALAERLGSEDGTSLEVTSLLDLRTVWVVPFVNPDGVVYGSRQNARDVDLNRNYDFEWRSQSFLSGSEPFSEPETRAVRTHALATAPSVSLSLHSGAANIGYVWNYSFTDTPDHRLLAALAARYRDTCTTAGFYATNGADWYRSWGDTNDWSYGRYGGMDFTVELTVEKTPPASQIPAYVAQHRDALLAFLATDLSVRGEVTDADTGRGIPATVTASGAAESAPFLTDLAGQFSRHAPSGATTLTVSAPGYATATASADAVNVALVPETLAGRLLSPGRVAGGERVGAEGLADGTATLSQPGHPDQLVTVSRGVFTAPALDAGAWTLVDSAGTTFPRGLLVEGGGSARRDAVTTTDERLVLTGVELAEGTRAWALVGQERAWVELAIAAEDSTTVEVALGAESPDEDFMVLTNGTWLAHTGRTESTAPRDTAEDTGGSVVIEEDTGTEAVRAGCGCATGRSPQVAVCLAPLLLLRRRRS